MDDDLVRGLLAIEAVWAGRRSATETHYLQAFFDTFVGHARRVGTPITKALLHEVIPNAGPRVGPGTRKVDRQRTT